MADLQPISGLFVQIVKYYLRFGSYAGQINKNARNHVKFKVILQSSDVNSQFSNGRRKLFFIHDTNFVNPDNPDIHTQNIENIWMRVK